MNTAKALDRLQMGMGSLADVRSAVTNLPSGENGERVILESLADDLSLAMANERIRESALALIAAALNAEFHETGYLYAVADKGGLDRKYFMTGDDRNMIAKLAGF